MSVFGLFAGTHTLLVGVEDDPEGGLRLYLGHRAKGAYAVIDDPEEIARIRQSWGGARGYITVPIPPAECIYVDEDGAS